MGGKGSGGSRPGAGRKPVSAEAGAVSGSRRARARAKQANQNGAANQKASVQGDAPPHEQQPLDLAVPLPPGNMTLDELAEWNELAPRAMKEGTLTESTVLALRDLCQARVLKDKLLRKIGDLGDVVLASNGNLAANPLLSRFTTLLQRVEAGMVRFKLSPMGKEISQPAEKAPDPFAEFDDAGAGSAAGKTH